MKKFLFVALLAMLVAGSANAAYVGVLTTNLKQGMTSSEVTILQQGLAQDATVYPQGLVTGYFGPLTNAAVIKFQEKYTAEVLTPVGLTAGSGFVGSMTRAKFNALYGVVSPTATPTPTATPAPTPSGVEGSITVTMNGIPADGTQAKAGQADVAISGFDVKAVSSNMAVQRVYVNWALRPWLYFSDVSLWDGSQLLARKTLSSSMVEELTAGSDYRVSFDGLNVIINKDVTKTLTVKVTVLGSPVNGSWPSSGESTTIKANAVRAVDGLGINQYGPATDRSARTFDAMASVTASIEVLSNTNTPANRVVQISSTTVTTEVDGLVFDLKAKDNNATLKTLKVDLASGSANLSNLVTALRLYQGSTLLTSTAVTGSGTTETVTFTLSSPYIALTKDARTTFTVKVDWKAVTSAYTGDYVTVGLTGNTTNVVAEDPTNYGTPVVSGTVAGKRQYAYPHYPTALLASVPTPVIDANTSTLATVSFTVNVTAVGADMYVAKASNFIATSTAGITTVSSSIASAPDSSDSTDNYIVRSGSTRTFTVSVVLDNKGGASAGFKKAWLYSFKWTPVTDAASPMYTWTNQIGWGSAAAAGESFYSNEIYMLK